MRDGYGIQKWPNNAIYEGQWSKNRANGNGTFRHFDGDVFEGNVN